MKHFVKPDGSIWGFEADGSQDHLITPDMTPITIEERDELLAAAADLQANLGNE